ncbi:hypothetical protein J3R30DRAFT_3703949 [Lentinula aciculospora]|uniref:Mid2 domain-containing protein n=1 Tax=Lentinula aciculospora TaxID=153920 RepID=A0A9W9A991_9AGAR|nr:hypothetical protein J3R30DRAFT_3703949 [Lentinula aciculospora]
MDICHANIYPTRLLGLIFTVVFGSVCSFQFSIDPSPAGVEQTYQIIWNYVEDEAPNNFFGIEVQGENGYIQWLGFFNSSGSTFAPGLPFAGFFTLAAYTNVPGANNGTFFTTLITAQSQSAPTISSLTQFASTIFPLTQSASTTSLNQSTPPSTSVSITTMSSQSTLSSSGKTVSLSSTASSTTSILNTDSSSLGPFTSGFTSSSTSSSISSRTASSLPPPSTNSKPNKDMVIIGVCSSVGALIVFILLGFYCMRKRRKIQSENKKLAATPYAYTHNAKRIVATLAPGPSSSSSHTRLPPSKRSADAALDPGLTHAHHVQLSRNTRHMRVLYDTSPPSYRELSNVIG